MTTKFNFLISQQLELRTSLQGQSSTKKRLDLFLGLFKFSWSVSNKL